MILEKCSFSDVLLALPSGSSNGGASNAHAYKIFCSPIHTGVPADLDISPQFLLTKVVNMKVIADILAAHSPCLCDTTTLPAVFCLSSIPNCLCNGTRANGVCFSIISHN